MARAAATMLRAVPNPVVKEPAARKVASIAVAARATDMPESPYEVRDSKVGGLLLRVQPSGYRSYYLQVRRGERVRLGPANALTLEMARAQALKRLADPEKYEKRASDALTLREYLNDVYEDFASVRLKGGKDSVGRVRTIWKSLLGKRMGDITAAEVEKIRVKRQLAGVAPATINRDISALSGVFAHWAKSNKGAVHPLRGLEPLKVPDDEKIRYLSPAEEVRLRKALADRDAQAAKDRASANVWRAAREYEMLPEIEGYADHITPMVLLSLNTGVRRGELFAMAWENVDLERRTLSVLASHSKGARTRVIPLNSEALEVLNAIKPGEDVRGLVFKSPVTGREFDNVSKAWAEVTKAAKLPDFRWHDLRHTFASNLVQRGVSLYVVQGLLGHSNSRMTQRYARLAPSVMADAVAVLERRS